MHGSVPFLVCSLLARFPPSRVSNRPSFWDDLQIRTVEGVSPVTFFPAPSCHLT
jgi:hypothetical protein